MIPVAASTVLCGNVSQYGMGMKPAKKNQERELIQKYIRNIPLFKNVPDKHLEQVLRDFSLRSVKKNEVIVFQSDSSTDMYIVIKGKAKATLLGEDGDEFLLANFTEGDFFGEMSLIDGSPRSATVTAEESTTLGVLTRNKLLAAISNDPAIAIDLLSSLVQRLRLTNEIIANFAFLDVRKRLLKLFGQLIIAEGTKESNGSYRIRKHTHKELAARIGASREAITKILKSLIISRLLHESNGYFLISPDIFKDTDRA